MAKRMSTSRTRSGCRTCKVRRVKCDEQRPSCRQCLDTGRACDGYGIWGQPKSSRLLPSPVYSLQALPGLAEEERRCLDRFRVLLTDRLTRPFGSHFWSSLVLQLSLSEPAVLHASIALTSAYESFAPAQIRADVAMVAPTPFLLRQYNYAIRALLANEALKSAGSLRVAAVSCILFICLEILRGDLDAMEVHFAAGIKLLHQLQHQGHRLATTTDTVLVKHDPERLDDHLIDVFARLNLQFLMLGHGPQQKEAFVPSFRYGRASHLPRRFSAVNEARQALNPMLLSAIHLVKQVERLTRSTDAHPPPPRAVMLEKQKALQAAIVDWIASYDNSIQSAFASVARQERLALLMLRTYADVAAVLLSTCFTIKETAYDAHLPIFESIIQRYSDVHSNDYHLLSDTCEPDATFMIDTGLFSPLYFTALKCRNHATRHQALSILRQYVHMEGPWTGPMLARVAGHVVSLEEEHFGDILAKATTSTTVSMVLPEFSRIHCVECRLPARRHQGSNIASLILRRFRYELGTAGGWWIGKCAIDLSPPATKSDFFLQSE
ncbi:hypothetical protein BDW72DRAFT_213283 [Aspergillus terricola var. indicus]